jgi:DNA-binding NarL/FixJ family response regulator
LALVESERPHLIVMDLYMPGMNGVEVLRRLRGLKYTGVTMMLTGSQEDQLLKEALDLGTIDIVSKAADPERIVLAIEARLVFTKR